MVKGNLRWLNHVVCATLLVEAFLLILSSGAWAVIPLKDLPAEEQKLSSTVDPWGLAFGDQVARFVSYFAESPKANFAVGVTHNLVKIWPNKYWFRGLTTAAGKTITVPEVWGATGTTVTVQVAVLPKMGAQAAQYSIKTTSQVPVKIFREEFVKMVPVPYGVFHSESWPDPLIPETTCDLEGVKLGVFLVEVTIPPDYRQKTLTCGFTVEDQTGQQAEITLPIKVVSLRLTPKQYPVVAWFNDQGLSESEITDLCRLALDHHLQPLIQNYLQRAWDPKNPDRFDAIVTAQKSLGQNCFQIPEPDLALYDHLKSKGWLPNFMIYSNADEPAADTFVKTNIPYAKKIRESFPGLSVFLASEPHERIAEGCDRLLTDLSSSLYDPRTFVVPKQLELWHYYCHLPVNFQMRAPLSLAPNMQIDNTALEQRVALWMSWYFGAKGVFIYAGNYGLKPDFWTNGALDDKPYPYPYGGCHNGNGFLVYPPRAKGGPALPSLRLKILRDAIEDLAILEAAKAKYGKRWKQKLSIVPEVFTHPHYYDLLPETLLNKREALLRILQ